mgnify:FL=1
MDDQGNDDGQEGPSKSAVKREMTALQALGARLTELPAAQLKHIPIENEQLYDAIMLARRITARSGRRRQLQFIGKLMRNTDPSVIEGALARLDGQHEEQKARFHRLENLRDRLLQLGDKALPELLVLYPDVDRQTIRQLVRSHQAEQKNNKPLSAARKLFRYLRELDSAHD